MPASGYIIVLTNCGSAKEARHIARALVEKRLAACVNMLAAPVESVYWWAGKLETAKEITLLIKTSRARYAAVERAIRALHSYEVPEIIAIPITAGWRDYLAWLAESVTSRK
ncbi:MAG TPA: divalent-cation tolerance protein CutA [Candidatus Aquilonibacter sp.]|nr:divalent-cation tolerance protein CutA [Candidatus Aquilonibacter sp.]